MAVLWWALCLVAVQVSSGAPCIPNVLLDGAAQDSERPWKYEVWQQVEFKTSLVPSDECRQLPEELEYCWQLDHRRGPTPPPPTNCDSVTNCSSNPVLAPALYSLTRANYTLQVLVRLAGKPQPSRCLTGYFVVQPIPKLSLRFAHDTRYISPYVKLFPFYVRGLADPDMNPALGDKKTRLNLKVKCSSDDRNAWRWCKTDFKNIDDWMIEVDQPPLTPDPDLFYGLLRIDSSVRPGYWYNFTARITELEWPYRSSEASQDARVLRTDPTPDLHIITLREEGEQQELHGSEGLRLLPTEKIHLSTVCMSCLPSVPINYKWTVQQVGLQPVDLEKHTEERLSSGVGLSNITLLPGALDPSLRMTVEVQSHYAPSSAEEKAVYTKAVEEYRKFQGRRT